MQYTWKYVQRSQLNCSWLPFPKQVYVDRKKNTHVIFSSSVDIVCRDVASQWSYKQNK